MLNNKTSELQVHMQDDLDAEVILRLSRGSELHIDSEAARSSFPHIGEMHSSTKYSFHT